LYKATFYSSILASQGKGLDVRMDYLNQANENQLITPMVWVRAKESTIK
jgi:hypothetical protein